MDYMYLYAWISKVKSFFFDYKCTPITEKGTNPNNLQPVYFKRHT